jgi:glycosyltransferase involved in cell wall biosynthesis
MAEVALLSLFAKLRRKRLLIIHNGDLILPKGLLNWILEKVFDVMGYISGLLADRLVAYSDDYAKHSRFLKHFLKKTTAIFPLFPIVPAKAAIQKRLRSMLPMSNVIVIGFAGRFVEEKGFDILLRAIPYVIKKVPNALFVFAGETHMVYENFFEQHQGLLQSVQNHFFSFGLLTQEEMRAFYPLLDLFVLPSRSDCLAFVQVEAMLAQVPVVVTDIPGARVPVQQTGMGKLVPPENPKTLAEGIIEVVKQKKEYTKEWRQIQKIFDYRATVEKYVEVIKGQ